MRKLASHILALLVFAIPASAEEKGPWANKFFTGQREAAPPVIVHDFGVLKKGTTQTYRIDITNIYALPMEVDRPSVGSKVVSIKDCPRLLNEREKGFLLVEIDAAQFEGKKTIKVLVHIHGKDTQTKEPYFSTATLEIRAESK